MVHLRPGNFPLLPVCDDGHLCLVRARHRHALRRDGWWGRGRLRSTHHEHYHPQPHFNLVRDSHAPTTPTLLTTPPETGILHSLLCCAIVVRIYFYIYGMVLCNMYTVVKYFYWSICSFSCAPLINFAL